MTGSGTGRNSPRRCPLGSILFGRYIVGRVLGQGGFGITYLAQDYQTKGLVAIKEFFPESLAARTERTTVTPYSGERGENFAYGLGCFLDEAKTMAEFIGNPNITRIDCYFEENGTGYFVMEYLEGDSFLDYIQARGRRIPWDEAMNVVLPVMNALEAMHAKGIIHRDVTPDNIYITKDGTVKLLDFGAARHSLGNVSHSLDVILKYGFAPKEQYSRRGKQGPFTDVYSLGATLYYAITGTKPDDAVERLEEDNTPLPTSLGARITDAQEEVVMHALAVLPADRYQNIPQFREALLAAQARPEQEPPKDEPKQPDTISREETPKDGPKQPDTISREETPKDGPKQPDNVNREQPPKQKKKLPKWLIGAAAILVIVIGAAVISSMGGEKEVTISAPPAETAEVVRTAEETTEEPIAVLEIVDSLEMNDVDLGHTELVKVLSGPDAREITWSSSNPQAAPVSENGTVTAAGYGTSEITAEYQGQTAVCTVTVNLRANVTCKYKENETGVTITGYQGELPAEMVLPREINGKPVTRIGDKAFMGCTSLTNVTIPDSVTVIGDRAFVSCTRLTSVTIPDSVTEIGGSAFSHCTRLTSVTIPDGVTEIGFEAFRGCTSLTSVTIPDSVTEIKGWAFDGCTSLTSVSIPKNCTLGKDVFPSSCKVTRR